jgi:ATP-dependent DNA helicase RecQ
MADCVLIVSPRDRRTHEFMIDQAHPPREVVEAVYEAIQHGDGADHRGARAQREVPRRQANNASISIDQIVRAAHGAEGENQVRSALRILAGAGVVRLIPAPLSEPWVRLIASAARIHRELAHPDRAAVHGFLHALHDAVGTEALYRGTSIARQTLGALAGSPDEAARTLDALQDECFLEWIPRPGKEGVQLLLDCKVARLPVSWEAHQKLRHREEEKLRSLEEYAATTDCRRGYVLRYFGDPAAMDSCDTCDNCRDATVDAPLASG